MDGRFYVGNEIGKYNIALSDGLGKASLLKRPFCEQDRRTKMKPSYLGDSYDIVKQSLLRWLSSMGLWATHPMFTEPVSSGEADAYARLLGTRLLSIDPITNNTDRVAYLAPACECHENVFLDPDTGIRLKPTRGKKAPFYIFGTELIEIVSERPDKLVLVFDQSLARGSERQQLQSKLQTFAAHDVYSIAYVSHACFVLLGRDSSLVELAFDVLQNESRLPRRRFLLEASQNKLFQQSVKSRAR